MSGLSVDFTPVKLVGVDGYEDRVGFVYELTGPISDVRYKVQLSDGTRLALRREQIEWTAAGF